LCSSNTIHLMDSLCKLPKDLWALTNYKRETVECQARREIELTKPEILCLINRVICWRWINLSITVILNRPKTTPWISRRVSSQMVETWPNLNQEEKLGIIAEGRFHQSIRGTSRWFRIKDSQIAILSKKVIIK